MDILLSIGMFVFGFFAEKLLDFIFNVFKIKLKNIKKREKINNFYKTEHENIIITATGVPYFYVQFYKNYLFFLFSLSFLV